jgi:hypothetical protein
MKTELLQQGTTKIQANTKIIVGNVGCNSAAYYTISEVCRSGFFGEQAAFEQQHPWNGFWRNTLCYCALRVSDLLGRV